MADTIYNVYKHNIFDADEDWLTGDYRMLLLTGAVTIDPDHATVSAVVAANTEASDGSYARIVLTGKATVQNDTADRAEVDAADIDFGALDNETPTAGVIFRQVTNDADSIPMAIFDSGFGDPANGAGYVVSFPNNVLRAS